MPVSNEQLFLLIKDMAIKVEKYFIIWILLFGI